MRGGMKNQMSNILIVTNMGIALGDAVVILKRRLILLMISMMMKS